MKCCGCFVALLVVLAWFFALILGRAPLTLESCLTIPAIFLCGWGMLRCWMCEQQDRW